MKEFVVLRPKINNYIITDNVHVDNRAQESV